MTICAKIVEDLATVIPILSRFESSVKALCEKMSNHDAHFYFWTFFVNRFCGIEGSVTIPLGNGGALWAHA